MFVPCDSRVHISGHILDAQHRPIPHSKVEFYGVTKDTDQNGCFYFGGVLATSTFELSASGPGYKDFKERKKIDFYDVEVTLAPKDSDQTSSATWKKLDGNELA